MSSILDALKKLENEKAVSTRSSRRAFETLPPEQQLTGRKPAQGKPVRPWVLIGLGALGAVMLVTVSVGVSLFVVRGADRMGPVASVAVVPAAPVVPATVSPAPSAATPVAAVEPKPAVVEPPITVETKRVEAAPAPVEPAPPTAPAPVAEEKPVAPVPAEEKPPVVAKAVEEKPAVAEAKPEPEPAKPEVQVKAPEPEQVPEPIKPEPLVEETPPVKAAPAPVTVKRAPEPVPVVEERPAPVVVAKAVPPAVVVPPRATHSGPVNVALLPPLRNSDKATYGLEEVQLNMLRPASKNRPYASAIINLQPVEIGEVIPGSTAILIAVEKDAVAIEIQGSGERFQMRF